MIKRLIAKGDSNRVYIKIDNEADQCNQLMAFSIQCKPDFSQVINALTNPRPIRAKRISLRLFDIKPRISWLKSVITLATEMIHSMLFGSSKPSKISNITRNISNSKKT